MRKREQEPVPKPFEDMSPREQADRVLRGEPAGTVYAHRGEPTAEEMRKLQWELTPAEKEVFGLVVREEMEYLRNMTPEQSVERVEKIRKSLGKGAVADIDPELFE